MFNSQRTERVFLALMILVLLALAGCSQPSPEELKAAGGFLEAAVEACSRSKGELHYAKTSIDREPGYVEVSVSCRFEQSFMDKRSGGLTLEAPEE